MFPIIEIGPFAIQAAGFFLLISFALGIWLTGKFSEALGTNTESIENGTLLILIVFLISARLGFILQNPQIFTENISEIISLSPKTLNINFGILVSAITAVVLAQRNHLPLWPTLDALTPLLVLLVMGGHLANFANGDAFGLPTELPWALEIWGAKRHPVQLYALVFLLAHFLWMLLFTKGFKQTGFMHSGLLFSISIAVIAIIAIFTRAFLAEKVLLGRVDLIQVVGLFFLIIDFAVIYLKLFQSTESIKVILSLGSNINPQDNFSKAQKKLQENFKIHQTSSLYRTEAVKNQQITQDFLNKTLTIETTTPFPELYQQLKTIEAEFGRESGNKIVVPLDIDIITYGDEVFTHQGKQLPDPDLVKYRYIAQPLAEMAPDFRHPGSGISIQKILDQIKDESQIVKLEEVENGTKG